jgi:hypothetical protein
MDTDRRFPVLVSTTNHYVVWVEGDSLKDAAARLSSDSEWYEALDGTPPRNADYDIAAPDDAWDWSGVYERRQGPDDYCAHCDHYSHDTRPIWHKDGCPKRPVAEGGAA